ncbi:MAG: transglycosylase SLT domain-containing protein [Betaproteobacteria bacterium]
MIRPTTALLLCSFALLAGEARSQTGDAEFLAAREAFQKGQGPTLDGLVARLQGHPLAPWAEYWQLRLRLAEQPSGAVRAYLERYAGQLPANRLRADWLRQLARTNAWDEFQREFPALTEPDTELRCLSWVPRMAARDATVGRDARALWLAGGELPAACMEAAALALAAGALTENDVWARLRMAFSAGNASLAKSVAALLPAARRPDPKLVEAAAKNPQRFLEARGLRLDSRAQREVALFALGRMAASAPPGAAQLWTQIGTRLPAQDRAHGWGLIAVAAARRHQPEALDWYTLAEGAPLENTQLAWAARAALRGGDWPRVLDYTARMDSEESERTPWRYWRARAMAAVGRSFESEALFTVLAREQNFHGQLAAEELGISTPARNQLPLAADIDTVQRMPAIQRALAWYRLGLRYEGNMEWIWAVRDMADPLLIAAAEVARREGWYERSIATAERSTQLVNFELRYPVPYPELLRASARDMNVDEALLYGLVRQESRFVPTARSSAGAAGLMQIMPTTARWVAARMGLKQWRHAVEDAVDANVSLGTFYLKEMLTRLDGSPVLASAAYNAGPGRAQAWRADRALEGAVYIDTIPFTETRDYVRKVMANAHQYARQFGHSLVQLRARIGTIAPRTAAATGAATGEP